MGYASEFNVERYLRESFVPRIAPVSRVSDEQKDLNESPIAEGL